MHRIYFNDQIIVNSKIDIHNSRDRLINVLRFGVNDEFRLFNNNSEYLVIIKEINKKYVKVLVKSELKIYNNFEDNLKRSKITIAISIINPVKMVRAIDMAVQLGVDKIYPIVTERTQYRDINYDRLSKKIIASVEQSNRNLVPKLEKICDLTDFIDKNHYVDDNDKNKCNKAKYITIFADEKETKNNMINYKDIILNKENIVLLVGPEGGFTERERKYLFNSENIYPICLNRNILRAETAVASIISQLNLIMQ